MSVGPFAGEDVSGGALQPPDLPGAGNSVAILQFPSQVGFLESTILRIRGALTVPKSTYTTSPTGTIIFAFGIGIVSDEAASALAVPNPATASGVDWDGWLFLRQSNQSTVEAQATIVDVKAMRKWQSGQSIIFVAGLASELASGTNALDFGFSLRGLFLLP